MFLLFFFKQKTAYELRISDWSSDVCSSDLDRRAPARHVRIGIRLQHDRFAEIDVRLAIRLAENLAGLEQAFGRFLALGGTAQFLGVAADFQIGRASCRERVCQYV